MKESDGFCTMWRTDLINNIVKEGCIPYDLSTSILVAVYKVKGDQGVCGSYRAITLLKQPVKVLERALAPNDTVCKRWSCHISYKLLSKLCRNLPPQAMGVRFTFFLTSRSYGPVG